MKKILPVIIILSILLSFTSFAGEDYLNHWAKNSIEYLLQNNVISGDAYGVRPDDTITRAEFTKVTNRIFGFTEVSEEGFPDVSEQDWFYNELRIAKAAGYMAGDEYGNANPQKIVTRAEASVMYARILKLTPVHVTTYFEDDSEIPAWAKDSVYSLSRAGMLLGYVDGTFKASNNMTRAEVFSISHRMAEISLNNDESDGNKIQTGVATTAPIGGSGGGGGGGGGGAVMPSMKLATPIIRNIDSENKIILWDKVNGAKSYEIIIKRVTTDTVSEIVSVASSNTFDFTDAINSLMVDKKPTEKFTIQLRAIAQNALYNSNYSYAENFTVLNPSIKLPEIKLSQTYNNGEEEVAFVWEAAQNASGYTLYIDFGSGYQQLTVDGTKSVIPYELLKLATGNEKIKFKALSASPQILDSDELEINVEIPLYGGNEGTANLIYNQRHFENISRKKSGTFIIAGDFTLTDYTPISDFNGVLKAKDNCEITVNINLDGVENVGLFSTATGAVFENLIIKGSIVGGKVVGAVTGTDLGDCEYNNISNYADITANASVGGITGLISASSSISDCINYGDITSANTDAAGIVALTTNKGTARIINCTNKGLISAQERAGGIVSLMRDSNAVYSCKNEGDIYVSKANGGGIAGYSYSDIYDSYNAGNIQGKGVLGGIIGRSDGALSIVNCYNTGNITSDDNYAGGIIGYISINDAEISISNAYNAGKIESDPGKYMPIYGYSGATGDYKIELTKCYYLADSYALDQGAISVSEAELKVLDLGASYGFSLTGSNPYYEYPQIISNPHTTGMDKLPVTPSGFAFTQDTDGTVTVSFENPSANHSGALLVTIYYDGNIISGYNEKVFSGNVSEISFSETEKAGSYQFVIVAENDDGYKSLPGIFDFELTKAHANNTFRLWLDGQGEDKENITPFEVTQ